jgi:pimeloyl-ACP methyl ester carboxylesterase
MTPFNSYSENRGVGAFVRRDPSGVVVISAEFGNGVNFGCPDSVAAIDDAINWAASRFGTRTDKVAIGGISMGGTTSLNWAWRNPSKVVAWAGYIPLINLDWLHDNTGYEIFIDLGYGIWVVLPGTNGSYASTPDHASLDITGDIDLRAEIAATDWTPGTNRSIISKYVTTGNQRSYRLRLTSAGNLELAWSNNGTTVLSAVSTATPSVSDGATLAVRATLDVDNNASGWTARFYTAPSLTGTWTQLGGAVTTAGTTSIFPGTAPVEVGSVAGGVEPFDGKIFNVEIRNGIDGTLVANPFNAGDTTGKAWTLHGSAVYDSNYHYIGSDHDPALHHAEIAAIGAPMAAWYGQNDPLCPPAFTEALAASVGSNFELFSNNGMHDFSATDANAFIIADWLIPKMLAADV